MTHRVTRAALLLVGLLLFFSKVFYDLLGGASNGLGLNIANDLINHIWPFLTYTSDSIRSGIVPLWNPYIAVGNSLVGELGIGLFHPATWTIFFIKDVATALLVSQLLTVVISMAGAYCYGSYLGLHKPAQILCVTLFGYAAFTESFSHTAGASSCWFPAILYLTHRFYDRPTMGRAMCISTALALCFFGGFANYFLYTCLIVGAYFVALLARAWPENGVAGSARRLSLMIMAVILLAGLIAIQFLPAYELSTASVRNLDSATAYDRNSMWESFSTSLFFMNFLLPDQAYLFANSKLKVDTGVFYLGGALMLLPFAFMTERHRAAAIALAVSCVAILFLILSSQVSALSFIRDIPFIGSLRVHGRGLVYVEFLLIALAAVGLSAIGERHAVTAGSPAPVAGKLKVLLQIIFIVAISGVAVVVVESVVALAGLLLCAALTLYAVFSRAGSNSRGRLVWLIVAVIVTDVTVHRENRFLVPAFMSADNAFVEHSASDYRAHRDHYRLLLVPRDFGDTYALANLGMKLGIPNISAYDNLTQTRWQNFIRAVVGPERFDGMIAASPLQWFYGDITPQMAKHALADERFLGLASLRYIYSQQGNSINDTALPRAYAVYQFIKSGSEEESLQAIRENIAALAESVVLENADPTFSPTEIPRGQESGSASVLIKAYAPNAVELSVSVSRPAIVVLTDAFSPGWEAYVDGARTDIFRANSLFRAVEVSAGDHSVVFRYRPTSLYLGMAISTTSICLALFLLLAERYFRKD